MANDYGLKILKNGNDYRLIESGGFGFVPGSRGLTNVNPDTIKSYGLPIIDVTNDKEFIDTPQGWQIPKSAYGQIPMNAWGTGKANIGENEIGTILNQYRQNEAAMAPAPVQNTPQGPQTPSFRPRNPGEDMTAYLQAKQAATGGVDFGSPQNGTVTAQADRSSAVLPSGPFRPRQEGEDLTAYLQEKQAAVGGVDFGSPQGPQNEQQAFLDELKNFLAQMQAQGKTVNPNATITPEMSAKFLEQAKAQVAPYWDQMFKQAQDDVQRALGQIGEEVGLREKQLGEQYGRALEGTQEQYARRGLAFSSDRGTAEKQLADSAQQALTASQRSAQQEAERIGIAGERALGSSFFPQISASMRTGTAPTLNRPGVYGFQTGTGQRSLFAPQGGVTGELQYQRTEDEKRRQALFENALQQQQGNAYKTY